MRPLVPQAPPRQSTLLGGVGGYAVFATTAGTRVQSNRDAQHLVKTWEDVPFPQPIWAELDSQLQGRQQVEFWSLLQPRGALPRLLSSGQAFAVLHARNHFFLHKLR